MASRAPPKAEAQSMLRAPWQAITLPSDTPLPTQSRNSTYLETHIAADLRIVKVEARPSLVQVAKAFSDTYGERWAAGGGRTLAIKASIPAPSRSAPIATRNANGVASLVTTWLKATVARALGFLVIHPTSRIIFDYCEDIPRLSEPLISVSDTDTLLASYSVLRPSGLTGARADSAIHWHLPPDGIDTSSSVEYAKHVIAEELKAVMHSVSSTVGPIISTVECRMPTDGPGTPSYEDWTQLQAGEQDNFTLSWKTCRQPEVAIIGLTPADLAGTKVERTDSDPALFPYFHPAASVSPPPSTIPAAIAGVQLPDLSPIRNAKLEARQSRRQSSTVQEARLQELMKQTIAHALLLDARSWHLHSGDVHIFGTVYGDTSSAACVIPEELGEDYSRVWIGHDLHALCEKLHRGQRTSQSQGISASAEVRQPRPARILRSTFAEMREAIGEEGFQLGLRFGVYHTPDNFAACWPLDDDDLQQFLRTSPVGLITPLGITPQSVMQNHEWSPAYLLIATELVRRTYDSLTARTTVRDGKTGQIVLGTVTANIHFADLAPALAEARAGVKLKDAQVRGVPAYLGVCQSLDGEVITVWEDLGDSIETPSCSHLNDFSEVLRACHDAGVVHGSLTRQDLLITNEGAKITNFDCALLTAPLTQQQQAGLQDADFSALRDALVEV